MAVFGGQCGFRCLHVTSGKFRESEAEIACSGFKGGQSFLALARFKRRDRLVDTLLEVFEIGEGLLIQINIGHSYSPKHSVVGL